MEVTKSTKFYIVTLSARYTDILKSYEYEKIIGARYFSRKTMAINILKDHRSTSIAIKFLFF